MKPGELLPLYGKYPISEIVDDDGIVVGEESICKVIAYDYAPSNNRLFLLRLFQNHSNVSVARKVRLPRWIPFPRLGSYE